MYKNVGKKISSLAFLLCIIGIIGSIAGGVQFGLSYNEINKPIEAEELVLEDGTVITSGNISEEYTPSSPVFHILGGLLIALSGSLSAWIGSFALYGFGHLITKSGENKELIKALAQK